MAAVVFSRLPFVGSQKVLRKFAVKLFGAENVSKFRDLVRICPHLNLHAQQRMKHFDLFLGKNIHVGTKYGVPFLNNSLMMKAIADH